MSELAEQLGYVLMQNKYIFVYILRQCRAV